MNQDFAARIQAALRTAENHANQGDADHLQWVINRMLEQLLGSQPYYAWRRSLPGWNKGRRRKEGP